MTALQSPQGLQFPKRRDAVRGEWSPLYIEPVVGSGERICIGVAAVNRSASLVVPVVALDRLECLYGKGVDAVVLAANVALAYTREVLGKHGAPALRSWKAPMDGIYIGAAVPSEGDTLEEIARTAETYKESDDHSIHGHIAHELFDFYGHSAVINDWSVLHSATVGSMMELFPHSDDQVSVDLKALQLRMVHHFKDKLTDNLDPETAFYPAITKFLLTHFGLHEPKREACCQLAYDLAVHFRKEFKAKFAKLWQRNDKFAADMLPSDMSYDNRHNTIVVTRFRRKQPEVFQLDDPS